MGYRMLQATLIRVFSGVNMKQTYRFSKEFRPGRVKLYRKKRTGPLVSYCARMQNHVCTMDIIHDSCKNGTKLWILSIVGALQVSAMLSRYQSISM